MINDLCLKPQNLPENLIWYYIIYTYPIYYLGGQYLLAPLLGYFLAGYAVWQWWQQNPISSEPKISVSATVWIWFGGMLLIWVALVIGHFDFDLGLGKIVSSSINRWLRTWMLFPLFMLAGSLKIRPQLIYRAICIFLLQSLVFVVIASVIRTPDVIYTSPLAAFGGGGFYDVAIFGTLTDNGNEVRMTLFAPWAPALGMVANVYFWLASYEENRTLKWLGMVSAIAMIFGSVSRLSILCLPMTLVLGWLAVNIYRPATQLGAAIIAVGGGWLAPNIINGLEVARSEFSQSRAGSSRVREVLGRIAVRRWLEEAFFWGHGTVGEEGLKVTGGMQIGTHHTWFSILYEHGFMGSLGLAIPLLWSGTVLILKAQRSTIARLGLKIFLILAIFTMGENIDGLTYLYWPGLIILGIALQENSRQQYPTKSRAMYLALKN